MQAWMVGSANGRTEVLPTVIGQQAPTAAPEETYTTIMMHFDASSSYCVFYPHCAVFHVYTNYVHE